jgi:hypothetical protein
MLLFYATYRRGRASIYGSAAAGGARAETASDNELHQSHEWNGNSMVSLRDGFKFEASSFKQEGRGPFDCGLVTADCGFKEPAASGCRRQNAQNKPNLAPPGAADRANCAKRSQTWVDWGMWATTIVAWAVARPGSETCKTNPIWPGLGPVPEAMCAKRSQTWERWDVWPKATTPTWRTRRGSKCAKQTQSAGGSREC